MRSTKKMIISIITDMISAITESLMRAEELMLRINSAEDENPSSMGEARCFSQIECSQSVSQA